MFMQVMILIRLLCVLIIAFLLAGCFGKDREESRPVEYSFDKVLGDSQLVYPVDRRTSFLSYYSTVYREGDKKWLVRVNDLTNAVQFYRDGKLDFQISYDYSGPNGIGKLMAVHVVSMDSIIILPRYSIGICIGNSRGEIYKRYKFEPDKMIGGTYGFIIARSPYPLIKYGSKLFLRTTQFLDSCDPRRYSKQSAVLAEIDLAKGTIKNIVSFPEDDNGKKFWTGDHFYEVSTSLNEKEGIVYISFPSSEYLYLYRIKDGYLSRKLCKTTRISRIDYLAEYECKKLNTEEYPGSLKSLEMSFYGHCAYAPEKGLIYRFYYLPADENIKIKREDSNPDTRLCAHNTGLLIVDEDMKVLADVVLPKYVYNTYDYFVTGEGLWLSRHNFFRPFKQEDKMEFDLIRY
ncbi:MAG: hypothetical protein KatS3mg032_2099 [Cyclobacteriaceae bacterium]|nr:MAG: hypothetical protein KatS3mg032_2099 [Cyclobacteriaceae bacterium]